ncbi:MAG: hypothetical protein QW292_03445 [Candidatus Parvarchaeota archaeon]
MKELSGIKRILNKDVLIRLSLKYSVILSIIVLLVGSILFTQYNALSQRVGLLAFLLICLFSGIIITGLIHERKRSITELKPEPMTLEDGGRLKFFILNAMAATVLVLLSLRLVIFSNTSAEILNPNPLFFSRLWPYSFNLISGYRGNGQGFIVQSFYLNLLSYLPVSTAMYEKILFVSEFYFYYFLASAVSIVAYNVFSIRKIDKSVFSILFSYLFLANFIFRSEGFSSFIIGPIMMAYVLLKFFEQAKYKSFSTRDAVAIGFAASFAVFGDPRMLAYYFFLTVGIILISPLFRITKRNLVFTAKSYAVILSLFGIMYFMTSFVPVFQANAGRSGNASTIIFFSSGTQPMYIFDFLANWWSNFVAAPPTLIFTGLLNYNYLPTLYAGNAIAVVPGGVLTILWSISLASLSIFAIIGIYLSYISKSNRFLLILLPGFLVTFLLTLGSNIQLPILVNFYALLSELPVVGPFWAVTISTPQFIDQYLSSYFILFASFAVLVLAERILASSITRHFGIHRPRRFFKKIYHETPLKYVPLLLLLFMFLFANWQFLEPSYALGQELPGEGLPGNQVGNVTFLTPVSPPPGWLSTYQKMYSSANLDYSVFTNDEYSNLLSWDHGFNIGDSPGVSPNPEFTTLFNSLMRGNYSWLLPTLMQEYGVRYIFFDKTQVYPNWDMLSFLNYSGLDEYKNSSADLFYLANASEISGSQYLFSASGMSNIQILNLSYLLRGAGYNMALSPTNVSDISFTNSAGGANGIYLSLQDIASMYPTNVLPGITGNYSGSSNSDIFYIGNDWYITRFNGGYDVNYSISNGTLSLHKYSPSPEISNTSSHSLFIMSYTNSSHNLPIAGAGVIDIPPGDSVIVHFAFSYTSTSPGDVEFFAGQSSDPIVESNTTRNVSGFFTIPAGTKDFGIGFSFASYNGTFSIHDPIISYTFVKNSMVELPGDSASFKFQGIPRTNYVVAYSASNSSQSPVVHRAIVRSNYTGVLNVSINGTNYVGEIAVFPQVVTSSSTFGGIIYVLRFEDGGSEIVMYDVASRYITISYNQEYNWIPGSGLKLIGTNELGQQVFEVTHDGEISIKISGALFHDYVDWGTAILMNVILPVLLFSNVIVRRRKTNKMSVHP